MASEVRDVVALAGREPVTTVTIVVPELAAWQRDRG
jgi:hypothetical protein